MLFCLLFLCPFRWLMINLLIISTFCTCASTVPLLWSPSVIMGKQKPLVVKKMVKKVIKCLHLKFCLLFLCSKGAKKAQPSLHLLCSSWPCINFVDAHTMINYCASSVLLALQAHPSGQAKSRSKEQAQQKRMCINKVDARSWGAQKMQRRSL